MTDAFVAFLEASWAHSDVVRTASHEPDVNLEAVWGLYREMRSQLTRLRLLASQDVLKAGEELLRRQRAVLETPPGPSREAALAEAAVCRRVVVDAAKKEMGL